MEVTNISDIVNETSRDSVPIKLTFDTWSKMLIESLSDKKDVVLTVKQVNSLSNTLHNSINLLKNERNSDVQTTINNAKHSLQSYLNYYHNYFK